MEIIAELIACIETGKPGPALSLCAAQLGRDTICCAAHCLIIWILGRSLHPKPWRLRVDDSAGQGDAVRSLVQLCPALGELFEVRDGRLDFRPHVSEEARTTIEQYAQDHYCPEVET